MFFHHHHIAYVQHLAILGLCEGATFGEVKSAYRTLAMQWHPDRFETRPGERGEAEERMKRINAAHDWLISNPYVFEVDWREMTGASTGRNTTGEEPVRPNHAQKQEPIRSSSRWMSGCAPFILFCIGGVLTSNIEWSRTNETILYIFSVLFAIGIVVVLLRKSSDTN